MSDKPEKLDSTGQPFRTRQRGGKRTKRAQDLAAEVEQGHHIPSSLWSAERSVEYTSRASGPISEHSVPARRADTGEDSPLTTVTEDRPVTTVTEDRPAPTVTEDRFGRTVTEETRRLVPKRKAAEGWLEGARASEVSGVGGSPQQETPNPKTPESPELPPLGPSKVTASAASSRELRPERGSLGDPSSLRGSRRSSGSESRPRVSGVGSESARAVLDFHGVLDIDPERTIRAQKPCFAHGVSEIAERSLRSALIANPSLQILVLSYIGHFSYKRRRETSQSFDRLKNSLGDLGFRVAFEICDRREDKPGRCGELRAACLVDDNWNIVNGARDCVDRAIWFSPDPSNPPHGARKTFDWGEVASYLARIAATSSPQVWDNLFN